MTAAPTREPDVPLDWIVDVDFYELPDYQARVASRAEAIALVHSWIKEGCVGKVERFPSPHRSLALPPIPEELVDTVYPISSVRKFEIRFHKALVGPGPVVSVSGRLPATP